MHCHYPTDPQHIPGTPPSPPNSRERGDPRELLRVINPREAQLADAASGVHVRFRLGGTTFPPLVFYKIFTHRSIVDICAFGPRDYASEVRRGQ